MGFSSFFSMKISISMRIRSLIAVILDFLNSNFLKDKNKLPRNWPILGMLPSILFDIPKLHDALAKVLEIVGEMTGAPTCLFKLPWFLNMDILGTAFPEDVNHIMNANFKNYPKGPEFIKIFHVLGDGIFTSDSDSWKRHRKVARLFINNQSFYDFIAKNIWKKLEKGLIPFLDHAAENNLVVDMQDVFQRLYFDTGCMFVMGHDPESLTVDSPDMEFSRATDLVQESIKWRYLFPPFVIKLGSFFGIGKVTDRAYATLDNVTHEYISMKKDVMKNGTIIGDDLLALHMNNIINADDKFLRDMVLTFMLAGRDTTSSALTWFLWLVSTNPLVLKKIREDLEAAAAASSTNHVIETTTSKFRLFKADELKNQVYLQAALCESMRLYPPVPFQHKTPLKPDILPSGHFVHPKMKIMISIYSMGRMKSIWGEDCKEFKPERWINSESGKLKHEPSYKYMAFNAGPRTCLGKETAFIQMRAIAAALIHNYNVQVEKGHHVVPNLSIILHMKHGLKVKISKRW